MDRLTTDNPRDNLSALLNFAFAKDRAVHLTFGNDEYNIPLDEYIAHEARERGCPRTTTEVMEGGCSECDCPIAILNVVAIQAAELRARLMMIEDILGDTYDLDHLRRLMEANKDGRRLELPCPMGSTLHMIVTKRAKVTLPPFSFIKTTYLTENNAFRIMRDFGKTVFLTREEAEAALAKMKEA